MKRYVLTAILGMLVLSPTEVFAYCGVLEQQASAKTTERAVQKAERRINDQVRQLKRKSKNKLVLSEPATSCLGGALAVDANGNQIEGQPSCTVTQPFCVNP
ncbi:hypothetical protein [Aestuariivirga litoralis]|uniref:hypothetical protein n=1 Tax=Aestuariivirga litoralis TaxID=2650924 RepID=UPI0018C4D207|nr:hypothetical protein [Aestuariivirga litoralis]MBG1231116.1 hypothetical protein [Aestuariivirga litoralis]